MTELADLKIGTLAPLGFPIDRAIKTTTKLEAMGYDSIWFPDHIMGWIPDSIWTPDITFLATIQKSPHTFPEATTAMAAHASHTEKLQIGTSVTDSLRKHPAQLAQTFVTLDQISKGRMILGLGAGEAENLIPYGIPFNKPVSRMEENLRIIKLLWESEPNEKINFDGEFFKLDKAVFDLPLYNDKAPPIWLGSHGPRMLRIAGELADGWLPVNLTETEYKTKLDAIQGSAKKFGRDETDITPGLYSVVVLAKEHEDCHEMFKTKMAKAWALVEGYSAYEAAGIRHPLATREDGKFAPFLDYIPTYYSREEILEAIGKVPDDLDVPYFHGTAEEVIESLEGYVKAGLKHVVLWNLTGMMEPFKHQDSVKLLKKVVSYIKE